MENQEIKTAALDHIGLVAATCKDLDIGNRINNRLNGHDPRRVVSAGTAVVAMILNGLGFTNRRLYLTHQFFKDKPVDRLLGESLKAEDITDSTLGKALDEIADYGPTQLFGEVAYEIAMEHNLLGTHKRLDTTSIYVHGDYSSPEPCALEVTYGHSKDHRPDLKQVVLSLVVSGPAAMPLWEESLSGNSNDSKSFHETIAQVRAFEQQIDLTSSGKWIADSKLYAKDKLLKENGYLWLTRVPETLKEARERLENGMDAQEWQEAGNGYRLASCMSNYGGVRQRWLIVYSEQAYKKEKTTFEKQLEKQEATLKKKLWHMSNELYACDQDAQKALAKETKNINYFQVSHTCAPVERYATRGRPHADDKKTTVGWRLQCEIYRDEISIEKQLKKKGCFILATNDLNTTTYPDAQMLKDYKDQQDVERGFRFLKDPWFMVDSIFLKSEKRISALMMVMTLCLMVYNIAQYKLRNTLKENGKTLPNQLGKQIQNPTLRWVFQLMEGIAVVLFYGERGAQPIREVVTNLDATRLKIIRLCGSSACNIYGIIENSTEKIVGM